MADTWLVLGSITDVENVLEFFMQLHTHKRTNDAMVTKRRRHFITVQSFFVSFIVNS